MGTLTELDEVEVSPSAAENSKDAAAGLAERAEIYHDRGKYQQALEEAKSAIRLDPSCLKAYIVAGKATMKLKQFDDCYNYYKEGLVLDPKNEQITEDLRTLQDAIIADFEEKSQTMPESDYKAVHMCSQGVYPGDDELFKNEVEILAVKYKVQANQPRKQIEVDLKTRKEAATVGVMAHNCRLQRQLKEAVHYCNNALEIDPTNDRLLQMRAEIYSELGEDARALQDLMTIPKPKRIADVWKMGGIILDKFELPVMAEFWFRKATAMVPKTETEAATLFQKVRVKRIYGPLTIDYPAKVEFLDYGRAILAKEKLDEGDRAFDDLPVVVGQLLNCLELPGCAHCSISLLTPKDFFGQNYSKMPTELRDFTEEHWPDVSGVVCGKCNRERYCSDTCQNEAWNSYHQIICPSVNPVATELYDLIEKRGVGINEKGKEQELWPGQYSPIVLAKMWGMIIAEAKRLMVQSGDKEPTLELWARAKMTFRKFIAFGTSSAVKRMPEIFSLMKRLFADCGDGVTYEITEAEFESRYYQATCNLQAFSASVTPQLKFVQTISEIEDLRSLRILKFLEEQKAPVVSFAGMFPLHACLNHACDNNVEVMNGFADGKPAVHVRVRREIKPDEELFTTYIDTAMPRKLRRAWLYKSFNFWCFCRRCQYEGDDNLSCTNCKKQAAEGKKFPGCSRCKRAWYCSTKCQKENWVKGHKAICQMDHSVVQASVKDIM